MDKTIQSAKSIVVTGPESSGKTTLAINLSEKMGVPLVEEQARDYLNRLNMPYEYDDLRKISQLQHDKINEAKLLKELIISDTDLLTLKIWGKDKYGKVDSFTALSFQKQLPSLYILCSPDIPWEPDPLRENPGDRDRLFQLYLDEIQLLNVPYKVVSGKEETRLNDALVFIRENI